MSNNIRKIIDYNLDKVDNQRQVSMPVRDFLKIYRTIEELRRFIHNENHYSKMEDIITFFGNKENPGIYEVLNDIYIEDLDLLIDDELEQLIESDVIACPIKPYYYNT
ncbi:MAG: hypothetical protein WBA74_21070 [Cyclobacteriaceae bacterium]